MLSVTQSDESYVCCASLALRRAYLCLVLSLVPVLLLTPPCAAKLALGPCPVGYLPFTPFASPLRPLGRP